MKRTEIQKVIIPRNWLFGRIAFLIGNIRSLVKDNSKNFTSGEQEILLNCLDSLHQVYKNKGINSEALKAEIRIKNKIKKYGV